MKHYHDGQKLQQGQEMHIEDIIDVWGVHQRTAKRDVSGLVTSGPIIAVRSGRSCRYRLPYTKLMYKHSCPTEIL